MSDRPLNDGRTPKFIAKDREVAVLSAAIRQRRADRRLAYTIDPGLKLVEEILAREETVGPD